MILTLQTHRKGLRDPPSGVPGLHTRNHCYEPVGLKHRRERVLNLGCWSWWVALGKGVFFPWEEGRQIGHSSHFGNDCVFHPLSLSVLTRADAMVVTDLASLHLELSSHPV